MVWPSDGTGVYKKIYTGTTAGGGGGVGGAVDITHGLTVSKVVSINGGVFIDDTKFRRFGHLTEEFSRSEKVDCIIQDSYLRIVNDAQSTSSVWNKDFVIVVELLP
jgi:hypothetical protein